MRRWRSHKRKLAGFGSPCLGLKIHVTWIKVVFRIVENIVALDFNQFSLDTSVPKAQHEMQCGTGLVRRAKG